MRTDALASLFDRKSHNPSFFEIEAATSFRGRVLDFCVPVNPYFPPPEMSRRIKENLADILKFYPDYAAAHQEAIAVMTGIPAANIVVANGSTELITSLCRDLKGPVLTPIPTFGRWTDLPQEMGVPISFLQRRREQGFRIEVDEMASAIAAAQASVAVICNPDNPTGASLSFAETAALIHRLAHLPLLVIDESFIDFSGIESAAALAIETPNTVIIKSLGKSLGWHGIRLGYAVAHARLAQRLRTKLPYWNINGVASFVLKSLPDFRQEYVESFIRIARDRESMLARLQSIEGLEVYPSKANFIFGRLLAPGSGPALRTRLLEEHGILIRECGNKVGSDTDHLRFAVLPPPAVDRLVDALEHCIEPRRGCLNGAERGSSWHESPA